VAQPKFCDQCGARLGSCYCKKPKSLFYLKASEHSLDYKVKVFDQLHEMCMFHVRGHYGDEPRCSCECDCAQYVFEAAMSSCLGKDIFRQLNNYKEYVLDEPAKKG